MPPDRWYPLRRRFPLPHRHSHSRGDGATLERALHLTMEQRATGETPILLADCGLDETGLRLAQGLTQRYSRVQLCPAEELENYLK